jgi:hypothetical protein
MMVVIIPLLECKDIDLKLAILYDAMVSITMNVLIPCFDFVVISFEGTQPSC